MGTTVYIALSKQLGLFKELDITANNIANSSTPGFKKQYLLTNEFRVDEKQGRNLSYANEANTVLDTKAGAMTHTNSPLDLAILQDGYFKINTPLGPRYTKGGRFRLNDNGLVVDHNFNPLASTGGDVISVPLGAKVNIDPSGGVFANNELVGQIGLFNFTNEKLLQPVGGGLYQAFGRENIALEAKIISGAYEESNVSGVGEMQNMLNIQRYSEMTNNIINIAEEIEKNTIKTLTNIAKQ